MDKLEAEIDEAEKAEPSKAGCDAIGRSGDIRGDPEKYENLLRRIINL